MKVMKILKKIKENLFSVLVLMAYVILLVVRPDLGFQSISNSAYYLKEMLLIMPVIFILTALLDLWIPKEKISKYLGKEAKSKGIVFSFVLGSISAGPIYAAFPMCVMLYKKGASIRNLVVILSSWAVIKIPMLLNEVKFLGLRFMVIRWILTVIAIVVFSWITAKIVKEEDIPLQEEEMGLTLNQEACMGCSLCVKNYPEVFAMDQKKAKIINYEQFNVQKLFEVMKACPVKAINYKE